MLVSINKIYLTGFFLMAFTFMAKAQSNPPYPVIWVHPSGVTINGGILTRTTSSGSWGGAVSSNLLASNTDGWLEFTAISGVDYIIGFAESNQYNYTQFTQGLQLVSNSSAVLAREGGANGVNIGSFQAGNVFRISREGSTVKYYKNGVVLRTVSVSATVELKAKASLTTVGTSSPSVTTSFDSQLVVYGTVTNTGQTGATGGIALSVSGGLSPYTYSWSSGESTSSLVNKTQGTYSVTVSDAAGRTSIKSFNIGYEVDWINLSGVTNNSGQLTRTAPNGTANVGALCSNILPSNTDGWIEFVGINGYNFLMGFTVNTLYSYAQYSYCISLDHDTGRATAFESAAASTSLGSFQTGDVFRISREGSAVKYYRNGIVLRTVSVSPYSDLMVKAILNYAGTSTARITTSFDSRLLVYGNVTGTDGSVNNGRIALSVTGGVAPYTFNWSSGEQTSSIENKPQGTYTVTVTDALGKTATRTYGVGFNVNWVNLAGVSSTDGRLSKTIQGTAWNAGAISSNILPVNTDGWIEFVAVNGYNFRIGLAANNIINYTEFTSGIYLSHDAGSGAAIEDENSTSLGTFQTGDVFRISREGSVVKYYRNGAVMRTINVSPYLELKVKAALSITGSTTTKVTSSFDSKLVVFGDVNGTEGANGSGSISLSVSGGASPYTYSWSSGEQSSSIENKARGEYSVTVTDALGRTATRTYGIGYKVNWYNLVGVTQNDGKLTKTAPGASWANGALGSNLLPPNTDGWIEFVGVNGYSFMFGLAVNNNLGNTQFSNGIFINHDTGEDLFFETVNSSSLGNFQTGDVFRIAREGSVVKYLRNGMVLRTVSVSPALELKVKAAMYIVGSVTTRITASFDSQLIVNSNVVGLEGNSGSGSITLSVAGGTGPYTYNWTNGEQTSALANKPRGAYTVTVHDAMGRTQTRTYNIGYNPNWINLAGVTNTNGRLTKTAQDLLWTSGAITSNILPANTDGWIEFIPINGQNFRLGLASNDIINSTQFTNSILIDHDLGRAVVFEGTGSISLGNFQTGDVFRISREGSFVKYYKNGIVLRTVSVNPSLVLKLKASLLYMNAFTALVNTSFWASDGIVRTYYAIANGNWTTPAVWSLTENGPPSTVYPDDIDKVVIKGHEVTVNSHVQSTGVTITSTGENTKLKVVGNMATLTVKGQIVMNRENNQHAEVLVVQNNGRLDVK